MLQNRNTKLKILEENKMSFLKTDYSELKTGGGDFQPLPIGQYEVIISKVEVSRSKAGIDMLKVAYTVRDDVEQAGKKRLFFENIVATLDWKFKALASACGIPEGKDFATMADFAREIQYKPVILKNKHEEYNGEIQDRVHWLAKSRVGTRAGSNNVSDDPFAGGSNKSIDITDDDLPF